MSDHVRDRARDAGEQDGRPPIIGPEDLKGWRARVLALRLTSFGRASEEPYRRRATDWVRLVLATAVLIALAVHAPHPSAIEIDFYRLFSGAPSGWTTLFRVLLAIGTLWAVGLAVAAAVIGRRWRLARDLLLAGGMAWALAHVSGALVAGSGLSRSVRAVTHVRGVSPQFPLARVAVVVAVIATAAPYLARPTRRVGAFLALVVAVSALWVKAGLPDAVLGGVLLGLCVATGAHLLFGSPGGRPTTSQVRAALAELGVPVSDLHLARQKSAVSTLMVGDGPSGPLMVRVIGRDEAAGQLFEKLWRSVVFKDSGPTLYLTRLQEVEHSAYLTIVAHERGVRTPDVLVTGLAGPKTAVLAERKVLGRVLASIGPAEIEDKDLIDLWRQVGLLRRAGIAHGSLDTDHVVISPEGPVIVGFGPASMLSSKHLEGDVASLLVTMASLVGVQRAVACLTEGLGTGPIPLVLPRLQPAALNRRVQAIVSRDRHSHLFRRTNELKSFLADIRTSAAEAAGVPTPRLQELHRVSGKNLLFAVGTLLGLIALLGQIDHPEKFWQTVQSAQWGWVAVAFGLSIATNVPYALALMGTVPQRLPFWPTTELQLSISFTNLAVPALGGIASQVRFLQKQGVDLASAVAAGGLLSTVGNGAVNIGVFAVAAAFSPHSIQVGKIPVSGLLRLFLGALLVASVGATVVLGVPRLRDAVVPPVRRATSTIAAVLRSPRQLALQMVGFTGASVLYGACLLACLEAFGASLSFWTLTALGVGVGTLSSLVPVPGGGTALSSVGMSAVLISFGVHPDAAVAAVLVNQFVVTYLPAVPGWLATQHLISVDQL